MTVAVAGTGAQVRCQVVRVFSDRSQGQRSRGSEVTGEERGERREGRRPPLRRRTHRGLARERPQPAAHRQPQGSKVYVSQGLLII